jgi:hypothetical protein
LYSTFRKSFFVFSFEWLKFIYFKVVYKKSLSTLILSKSLCFSMLLIFNLIVYSSSNTSLFSCFLTYNFALNFFSFSKGPCTFWTNMSLSSIIYLFFIFGSKSMSKILVICVLYIVAYWNILVVLLCSSKSAFKPCTDLGENTLRWSTFSHMWNPC